MGIELEKLNIHIQKIKSNEITIGVSVPSEINLPPKEWDIINSQLRGMASFVDTDPKLEPNTFKYNGMLVRRGDTKETPKK